MKAYRLNDKNEVEECNLLDGFSPSCKRIIKKDDINDKQISTIFLVIDHDYSGFLHKCKTYKPLVFETMVFSKNTSLYKYCERYRTYDDALNGHNEIIRKLKEEISLNENNNA